MRGRLASPGRKVRSCGAQILPFRAKSQFFANFALASNFFSQICDLAGRNFSQSSQILQFARKLHKDIY